MRLLDTAGIARLALTAAVVLALALTGAAAPSAHSAGPAAGPAAASDAVAGEVELRGLPAVGAASALAAARQDEVTELERRLANLERVVREGRLAAAEPELEALHADAARQLARTPDDERAQRLLVRVVVARYRVHAMTGRDEEAAEILRDFATHSPAGPLELSDEVRRALLAERGRHVVGGEVGFRLVDDFRRPGAIDETLARISTQMQIHRDLEGAVSEARELERALEVLQSERPDAPDIFDAALRLRLLQAQTLARLGRRAEALERLRQVGAKTLAEDGELPADLRAVYAARPLLNAQARELWAELVSGAQTDPIDALVTSAFAPPHSLENPNLDMILQLGARAVPALERVVLQNSDVFTQDSNDDLIDVMIEVDPARAAEFVLENLDHGGPLWTARIVRAMGATEVLSGGAAWPLETGFPTACARPGWLRVLERLLEEPEPTTGAIALATPVARHGAITPRLADALVRLVREGDAARRHAVLEALDRGYRIPSALPVLAAAVAHPDSAARRSAADQLLDFGAPPELLARADDPEPAVRATVARALSPRSVQVPSLDARGRWPNHSTKRETFAPEMDASRRALLLELAGDPDPAVRMAAFEAAAELAERQPDLVPPELWRSYTAHPDPRVRADLARRTRYLPPELAAELLGRLATDADPKVLSQVDDALEKLAATVQGELVWPALRARLEHTGSALPPEHHMRRPVQKVWQAEASRAALLEWLLARGDRPVPEFVVKYGLLARADAAAVGRFLPRLYEISPLEAQQVVAWRIATDGAELARVALETAGDAELAPVLELFLGVALATAEPARAAELVRGALHGREWQGSGLSVDTLRKAVSRVPADPRNALLAAVVADRETDDAIAVHMARELAKGPEATPLAHAILARWLAEPEVRAYALMPALDQLGAHPDERAIEVLRAAARVDDVPAEPLEDQEEQRVLREAIGAMGRVRAPELLPALERLLRGLPEGSAPWDAAVEAVTAYLSDDAVELLLAGAARAGTEEARTTYLVAVESVRTYLDARAAWAARRVGAERRAEVVAELVAMLADASPDVRREAARGLATYEAVEALPHLIRHLSDPDPTVAEAVRAALDRIHRASAPPPDRDE